MAKPVPPVLRQLVPSPTLYTIAAALGEAAHDGALIINPTTNTFFQTG